MHVAMQIYLFLFQISQCNKPDRNQICFDIRTSEHSYRTTFGFWQILQNGQAYLWLVDVNKYELESFFPGTVFFHYALVVYCKTKMWLAWAAGDHMSFIPWTGDQGPLVSLVPAYIKFYELSDTALGSWNGNMALLQLLLGANHW